MKWNRACEWQSLIAFQCFSLTINESKHHEGRHNECFSQRWYYAVSNLCRRCSFSLGQFMSSNSQGIKTQGLSVTPECVSEGKTSREHIRLAACSCEKCCIMKSLTFNAQIDFHDGAVIWSFLWFESESNSTISHHFDFWSSILSD